MDRSPRVSVIIPTFNRSAFLRQAIASVQAQTYADFELIVVDDGSTDDTAAAVAGFDDPRIIYVHQENAGRSAARNRAMAQASGEYIAFLDDDDLYLPHKLAVQVAFLETHAELGLVGAFTQFMATDGSLQGLRETWQKESELSLLDCLYACPLATCSVLLRRSWMTALDHWFDPELDRAEDKDFWVRLLLAGCSMAWTQDVVSVYRQHDDSSQQDQEGYYTGNLKLLDKLFTRSDVPEPVQAERSALYAQQHLLNAWPAYAAGQRNLGKQRLLLAVELAPSLLDGAPPAFVASLTAYAQTWPEADAVRVIEAVFADLPPQLAHAQSYRGDALSAQYMHRVFIAHAGGERPSLRDWLFGIVHAPRWLANRGVWSILVRDILLRQGAAAGVP